MYITTVKWLISEIVIISYCIYVSNKGHHAASLMYIIFEDLTSSCKYIFMYVGTKSSLPVTSWSFHPDMPLVQCNGCRYAILYAKCCHLDKIQMLLYYICI